MTRPVPLSCVLGSRTALLPALGLRAGGGPPLGLRRAFGRLESRARGVLLDPRLSSNRRIAVVEALTDARLRAEELSALRPPRWWPGCREIDLRIALAALRAAVSWASGSSSDQEYLAACEELDRKNARAVCRVLAHVRRVTAPSPRPIPSTGSAVVADLQPMLTASEISPELNGLQTSEAGPPPPDGSVAKDQPIQRRTTVPSTPERWIEEGRAWLSEKQGRGKWQGRNGYEALRFLTKCGEWLSVTPLKVEEPELWEVVKRLGPAPKTKRTYLSILGSFLSWRGNWVVQRSGIKATFPNRALNTPVITAEDRDLVLARAQGPERIVTALLGVARRRVEIVRARVEDFHLDRQPPTYDFRAKGGGGEVTHRDYLLTPSLLAELDWWLPLRSMWASRAASDSGHLLCRWDGGRLVGVSYQYVDRLLDTAEDRAGVRRWPAHAFRRGAATLLIDRGAREEDVSEALGDSSLEVTRKYIAPFVRRRRLAAALTLIEPAAPRGKS